MHKLNKSALVEVPVDVVFKVICDVEQYPEFVPACEQVQILETFEQGVKAQVKVSGKVLGQNLRETFQTQNTYTHPTNVTMQLVNGPIRQLAGHWQLTALGDIGCRVDLHIEYELQGLLAQMLNPFINPMADKMVDAFVNRFVDVHNLAP